MSIEEIPSDELVEMSSFWHRAFNVAGCDPMCHCCKKMIDVGHLFKLATVETNENYIAGDGLELEKAVLLGQEKADTKTVKRTFDFDIRKEYEKHDRERLEDLRKKFESQTKEVMLCKECTPIEFTKMKVNEIDVAIAERDKPKGGCFRINGKIIH